MKKDTIDNQKDTITISDHVKKPTVCLNMIVKNESKIILRMLNTVVHFIDTFCICDTGSTDNTVELIQHFFDDNNIKGKIVKEPFQNFEYNRNVALRQCEGMSDYILLMDADMRLRVNPGYDKRLLLIGDSFLVLQGNDNYYYQNVRIVKNNGLFQYYGVTHEYVGCDKPHQLIKIQKDDLFIEDIGDGGSKKDKFERDIRLLLQGIQENPGNTRYHFYLANSYSDIGQNEKAIEYYEKRSKMGGWEQEVWQSYFRMGICYKQLNEYDKAIQSWLEAYQVFPQRIENIYEIMHHYRCKGKHHLVALFYKSCLPILEDKEYLKKSVDYLFFYSEAYKYKIDYEYSVSASYTGVKQINSLFVKIFNACNDMNLLNSCFHNMKYYKDVLEKKKCFDFSFAFHKKVGAEWIFFRSSSSSLLKLDKDGEGGYLLNVRCVNYYVNEKGEYVGCEKKIVSTYCLLELDGSLDLKHNKKTTVFDLVDDGRLYIGVEDIRIFYNDDSSGIVTIGNGYHENKTIGVMMGTIDCNKNVLEMDEIKPDFKQLSCEKNWVYVNYKGTNHIIYNWYPLQICKREKGENTISLVDTREMPAIFKFARGSSCGYSFGEEKWFIIHLVSYEKPRHYYHMFVVFDKDMNLQRYSAPFKLDGECIEYCLGLVVEEERVIVPYSVMDRSTKIAVYDKKYIESKLVYHN